MSVSILFYIPNLIGYTRIIFMFLAYYYAEKSPYMFFVFYAFSQAFDMLDGLAARAFNQATKFGAMLDMVTDRCSTIGLLLVISNRYPKLTLYSHFFIWLDIFSHWTHMLAQLSSGAASHKIIKSGPKLLSFYYSAKWFMVLLIIGAEGFPCCLYLLSYNTIHPMIKKVCTNLNYGLFPLFLTKHFINLIQFGCAAISLDHNEKKAQ